MLAARLARVATLAGLGGLHLTVGLQLHDRVFGLYDRVLQFLWLWLHEGDGIHVSGKQHVEGARQFSLVSRTIRQ